MIKILAHRGHWTTRAERNGKTALRRAFAGGFGVETDIRDSNGRIVVSHDKPAGGEMSLVELLGLLPEGVDPDTVPLALNIKADGLAADVAAAMAGRPRSSWFVFDMSVPDLLAHLKAGLPAFTRISDWETEPVALDQATGVWVDGFSRDWDDFAKLHRFLDMGKILALVSPELHGRDHHGFWHALRASGLCQRSGMMLCTDLPVEAAAFLHE